MPYQKYTPFNLIAFLLTLIGVYYGINSGSMGWGLIITFYVLPFAFVIVIADLFLQGVCQGRFKPIFFIEITMLLGFSLYFYFRK